MPIILILNVQVNKVRTTCQTNFEIKLLSPAYPTKLKKDPRWCLYFWNLSCSRLTKHLSNIVGQNNIVTWPPHGMVNFHKRSFQYGPPRLIPYLITVIPRYLIELAFSTSVLFQYYSKTVYYIVYINGFNHFTQGLCSHDQCESV